MIEFVNQETNHRANSLYLFDLLGFIAMTAKEFRLENARVLAKAVGGIKPFADKADMSVSQASQIIGERPVRNIGDQLARKIELHFGRPPGWLDHPPARPPGPGHRPQNLSRLVFEESARTGRTDVLAHVAQLIGVEVDFLRERNGPRAQAPIDDELARKIERAFEKPHGWMDTQHVNEPPTRYELHEVRDGFRDAHEAGLNVQFFRDIPIVGHAIATPDQDGFFENMGFPPGAGDGYLPWQTNDPNAYALRVKGDSMQPRIRPGELIVVEPNSKVSPGDDVVVHCRNGRKMVKQLLIQRLAEVILGSINQAHQQTTLSLEDVEAIHFITAIVPRNANVKHETNNPAGSW